MNGIYLLPVYDLSMESTSCKQKHKCNRIATSIYVINLFKLLLINNETVIKETLFSPKQNLSSLNIYKNSTDREPIGHNYKELLIIIQSFFNFTSCGYLKCITTNMTTGESGDNAESKKKTHTQRDKRKAIKVINYPLFIMEQSRPFPFVAE